MVTADTLDESHGLFCGTGEKNDFLPTGLVALYDDIAYGDSLGSTAKFPRNSYAFKWADEMRRLRFRKSNGALSRTGLINPVAIFAPVELEGSTVSRASVHNISIMKKLELGAGDRILVYKANMIIPQIAENLTRSGVRDIPQACPSCGGPTRIETRAMWNPSTASVPAVRPKPSVLHAVCQPRCHEYRRPFRSHPGKIYRQGIYP